MKNLLFALSILALLFSCTEEPVGPDGRVTGITLDRSTITIREGESAILVATVKPEDAENKNVSWASSDVTVVFVDNGGKVTGIKAGSATVTAKTEDGGITASCVVTVEANLAPSVTGGADHISAVSAILAGKANLGPTVAADLKVGFQYAISSGILPSNSTTVEATDADASYNYTAAITGLEPETTYYYRSFVRQNGQDTYGETKEFKTKEILSIIRTQEASAISAINAQLNADLDLTDVKCSSSSFGFYWGTSDESLYYKVTATKGDGAFSADLLALDPSKQYYFQAFASFDGKEIKEAVKSFTTKDIETLLETKDASGIEATAATLNAKLDLTDVKYSNVYYGFYWWKYESSQSSYLSGDTLTDHSFTAFLSNLSPKTQYGYKAYVIFDDDRTFYGEAKTFTTDVIKVESVSLDRDEYTFNAIGSTLWLRATVLPADATDKSVEWSSSNADVVTVEQNGKVTAIGNGKARITVTTKDQGKTASCVITVSQYVTGISFDKPSLSLGEGEEYTLIPTITPSNAENKALTWTSSDESVARVDHTGKVTAVSKGSATIKATATDGGKRTATCSVTVKRLVSSITLDKISLVVFIGNPQNITATVLPSDADNREISYTSSNTNIAKVDSYSYGNLRISGVAPGNATITVKAKDAGGVEATCKVVVRQYVTDITLDKTDLDLAVGDTWPITATVSPDNAYYKKLDWTSENTSVAEVDKNGLVKAVGKGKVTITASAKDGSDKKAYCHVVVSSQCPTGAIDLGVRTSDGYRLYWATSNLSINGLCTNPEDYGDYYAWGETEPYYLPGHSQDDPCNDYLRDGKSAGYSWDSYQWCRGTYKTLTKYNTSSSYGTVDNKTSFKDYNYADDAARQTLGGGWRTPTSAELTELRNNSNFTWTWTTQNGVNGYLVKASSGNSIFLPAAGARGVYRPANVGVNGYYWSSGIMVTYWSGSTRIRFNNPESAFCLEFDSDNVHVDEETYEYRINGFTVRPVSE